jgi:GTP cyclohydrolase IA
MCSLHEEEESRQKVAGTFLQKVVLHGRSEIDREGLVETPKRVVKAWNEWTAGYEQDPIQVLKAFEDGAQNYDEMVVLTDIPVYSTCEHHLAPFWGVAHIAYIPKGKVVGLSKFARLVDVFARRLQVQERLTVQIADAIMEGLEPEGVGVALQCRHMCMESRGIQRRGTVTTTSALRGGLKTDASARSEFLSLVKLGQNGVTI